MVYDLPDFEWICCILWNYFLSLFPGDCDFKLDSFLAGTPETFEPHYGMDWSSLFYNSSVACYCFHGYTV